MSSKSLLSAYLLDGQGGGKKLDWDQVQRWSPSDGVLWVHLDYTVKRARQWLAKESGLDKITVKAMVSDESRPRSVISEQGVLLFLRGVNLNPGENPEDMVSIRFWFDKHRVITTRRRMLLSVQDILTRIEEGEGPVDAGDIVVRINNRLVDRMSDVLDNLNEGVDQLEEEVLTNENHLLRPKISELRRQALLIRRYLAPQKDALFHIHTDETPFLSDFQRMQLRETHDRLMRYIEDIDTARERAVITQEELSSRLSEQMEQRMYLLSVVSLIFLPLTFVTGLLGINVSGIPGQDFPRAFEMVCGGLFAVLVLTLILLKRKKWM